MSGTLLFPLSPFSSSGEESSDEDSVNLIAFSSHEDESPPSSSGEESSDGDLVDSIAFASREDEPLAEEDPEWLRQIRGPRQGRNKPFRYRRPLGEFAEQALMRMFESPGAESAELESILHEYSQWGWHGRYVDRSILSRFTDAGQRIMADRICITTSLLTINLDNMRIIPDLLEEGFPRFAFFIRAGIADRADADEPSWMMGMGSLAPFEPPTYRKRADRVLHKLVTLMWTSYFMVKYQFICSILGHRPSYPDVRGRRRVFRDWYRRVTGERLPTGTSWLIKIHAWVQSVSRLANGIKRWRHATSWTYTNDQINRIMQEAHSIRGLLEDFVTPTRHAYCAQIQPGLLVRKQKALRDALEYLLPHWAADMCDDMELQLAARDSHAHPSRFPSTPRSIQGSSSDPSSAQDGDVSQMSRSFSPQSPTSIFSSSDDLDAYPRPHQRNTYRSRNPTPLSGTDDDDYPCPVCNFIDCICGLGLLSDDEEII